MDHLNIFYPYENKPLHHEDQLTRAFLILLENIKSIEMIFVDMIIEEMTRLGCKQIPKRLTEGVGGVEPPVRTQVGSTTLKELSGRIVSVLVTDEPMDLQHQVRRTERIAVYDGIIQYNDDKYDWIFVIENKPDHRNVRLEQLSSDFSESSEVEEEPICLQWQNIIARITAIKKNKLLDNTETGLVESFLTYILYKFPKINPYDSFALCKENKYLLERRCISIMKESQLGSVSYHRGWHYYIEHAKLEGAKQITLYPEKDKGGSWNIWLALHPGDTMNQARHFYSSVNPKRVMQLAQQRWIIEPNFHLAFRSSNLVRTEGFCTLKDYLEYWIEKVKRGTLRQLPREDWDNYFDTLKEASMLTQQDDQKIRDKIIDTGMQKINVCPGISFWFQWSQAEAVELDNRRMFVTSFKEKVEDCISTWWKNK